MTTPILRKNLRRQIVDELGLEIVRGDYKSGDTFPSEPELSAQLGVSRTVIREAIKTLSDKGLVASRAKVGTQIQPRSRWNLLDPDILSWEYTVGPRDAFLYKVTEVRRVIEPAAARLATERATDEEIAVIDRSYQLMMQHVDDVNAFIPADMQFHAGILKGSHNEILERIVNTIHEALVTSRKVTLARPNSGRESMPLHHKVLIAIQNRQPDAAQTAMENLINSVKVDINLSVERSNDAGGK